MAKFDNAIWELNKNDFLGYIGDPPSTEAAYDKVKDKMFSANAPTWKEITAKITEMDEAEAKAKTDKISAYRKLSMTDDEINAIDPTLLQE